MKTFIEITGQPQGNNELKNSLYRADCKCFDLHHGGYRIEYQTKKEALKALALAKTEVGGVRVNKEILRYDASTAKIVNPTV